MTASSILAAYFISIVVGGLVAGVWSSILYRALNRRLASSQDSSTERIWWIPTLVGAAERAIITTLVIWAPTVLAGFVAGWMALKVAGGWGLLKDPTTRNRSTNAIGLLGSVVSIGWAIGVGIYFEPGSLAAFAIPTSN